MRAAIALALACAVCSTQRVGAQMNSPAAPRDASATYSGVYESISGGESLFSPCNVPDVGSGWAVRFTSERDSAFLRHQFGDTRMQTLAHFVRVRGRVSERGHYGLGYDSREIVVDSVLEISETPQPCPSFEDIPAPWRAITYSGARISGVAVTDDKGTVAVLDANSLVSISNTKTGALINRFPSGDTGYVSDRSGVPMQFTHDGSRLAIATVDGQVRVVDPRTAQQLIVLGPPDTMPGTVNGKKVSAAVEAMAINKSGTLLARAAGGAVTIWSTETGQRVAVIRDGLYTNKFAFLSDSSFMAPGDSGTIKIYPRPAAAGTVKVKVPVQRFDVMAPSPDGKWVIVKSWGDTGYVWSLEEEMMWHRIVVPHWFSDDAIAFSPDGKTVSIGAGVNALFVQDLRSGRPVRAFRKFGAPVTKSWFTADGRSIVAYTGGDSVLRVVHLDQPTAQASQVVWPQYAWPRPGSAPLRTSVVGFITDSAKKPLVGADVWIFDGDRPGSHAIGHTTTNAAGRYLLQGITIPHVIVQAGMPGYETKRAYRHSGFPEISADFELDPDASTGHRK